MALQRIALDNCVLVALTASEKSSLTDDERHRLGYIRELLSKPNVYIVIPAPVLCEYLAYHSEEAFRDFIDSTPKAISLPFDEPAAENAAYIERKLQSENYYKSNPPKNRQAAKVDRQVISICRVNRVDLLLTDDNRMRKLCNYLGLEAKSYKDIELPEDKKQQTLSLDS
jgi:hypothetical protein